MVSRECRFLSITKSGVIVVCLVVSFFGCVSTEPITLNLPYASVATNRVDQSEKSGSRRVVTGAVKDGRSTSDTVGLSGVRPLVAEHVTEWIQSRLENLSRGPYTLQTAAVDN